jgi:hypothetical protein
MNKGIYTHTDLMLPIWPFRDARADPILASPTVAGWLGAAALGLVLKWRICVNKYVRECLAAVSGLNLEQRLLVYIDIYGHVQTHD